MMPTYPNNVKPSTGGNSNGNGAIVEPSKYYILVVSGQSNAVGYGEDSYNLTGLFAPNPRIKQLGRYATHPTISDDHTVTESDFGYGDDFVKMRPFDDCNLQIIPASPCLDHVQNMFQYQVMGTTGWGFSLAKALLPYVPADHGILIVPVARGGSAFTRGTNGTYDETRKSASETAGRWGATTPLGRDLLDRIKHCLDLNPLNKMLAIVWAQGEFDAGSSSNHSRAGHYNGFKALFEHIRTELTHYANRFPLGNIENLRWFCLSSTKWQDNANTETVYESTISASADVLYRSGIYDTYIQLANEYRQPNGRSQIVFVSIDRDEDGIYTETNRESGNGVTTNTRQIHFSTYANAITIPRIVSNAILTYGDVFVGKTQSLYEQKTKGGLYSVLRDGVTTKSLVTPVPFDLSEGLILRQNFATAANVTDAETLATGKTVTATTPPTLIVDANFTQVAQFVKANSQFISYNCGITSGSHSRSVVFKATKRCWTENSNILSAGDGSDTSGIIWLVGGGLQVAPNWDNRTQIANITASACGGWNGSFESWQQLVTTYDADSRIVTVFLNGQPVCCMEIASNNTYLCNHINLGAYINLYTFDGLIANTRVYSKALQASEVAYLYYIDCKKYL